MSLAAVIVITPTATIAPLESKVDFIAATSNDEWT
jgi:hypothetical protein